MIGKLGKEVKALKKILIVEDDQLLNRTLAYNLTSDGYEVISVFNFDSAVRKLRENEFDVALLDINLPDGSGLDLCEEIRNRGQHTYIIFITANDIDGYGGRCWAGCYRNRWYFGNIQYFLYFHYQFN